MAGIITSIVGHLLMKALRLRRSNSYFEAVAGTEPVMYGTVKSTGVYTAGIHGGLSP